MIDQLLLARAAKLLVEIALLAELGHLVLGWWLGPRREGNAIFGVFRIVTGPAHRLVGFAVGPSPSRRQGAALVLLVLLWLGALAWKVSVCLSVGVAMCR
ncbi:MAG: hypothetical protein RLZZ618_2103 [Pseudomonadota bacterium]|jgi:hypothetical protein